MVDVVYGEQPDDRYYWVSQDAPVYADGVVLVNFTKTPKDFDQIKNTIIAEINRFADSLLAPTDYLVIKSIENGTVLADDWKTWRAQIRTQAQTAKAVIASATNVDELVAAKTIDWAHDPDYVASIKVK